MWWWIESRPQRGGLAGMPLPGPTTLAQLPRKGIVLLISLVETVIDPVIDVPRGLELESFPIENEIPRDIDMPVLERLCEKMHRTRLKSWNSGVGVHCFHGRQRTGMILLCYRAFLAERYPDDADGLTVKMGIESLVQLYREQGIRGMAPTEKQLRFSQRFTQFLRTGVV